MRILFINNGGGGFADHVDAPESSTVGQLFDKRVGGRPEDFLIRVNRLPAARQQRLQEGDRVSVTPLKIEGA